MVSNSYLDCTEEGYKISDKDDIICVLCGMSINRDDYYRCIKDIDGHIKPVHISCHCILQFLLDDGRDVQDIGSFRAESLRYRNKYVCPNCDNKCDNCNIIDSICKFKCKGVCR